ncbi:MAG: RagB/SusD family nutrient uptake outer membrane protein [Bacteroidetes bacterium]|nr:RagB/SusD family nutrient uptake outer membrane protein [Bacteroidota bacterium]
MKRNLIPIICIATLIMVASCKKFVDVGLPKNQLISSEVFADSTNANSALAGIYYSAISTYLGLNAGGLPLYSGLSADELTPTGSSTEPVQFYSNNILSNNNSNAVFWGGAYSSIYSANAIIQGVTASTGISAHAKLQLIGEARFVRAYEYFCLLNLYGGVPLVLSTDYKTTALMPRATIEQVYTQIVDDLQFAETNLGSNTGTNDRPNSLVASALLAKVYLYLAKNDLAATEATKVITSGNYSLEADPNNVFLSGSAETIWQLDLPYNHFTWIGQILVPTSTRAVPKYVINPVLLNSFETGDLRASSWINVNVARGNTFSYPYKYKSNVLASSTTEGYVLLRLADIYLVRAEAEVALGKLEDGANDINLIRARALLPGVEVSDAAQLLMAVQNERRHEMFCEEGNRWFDLKRWNLANAALGSVKTGWKPEAQLYPIPVNQISANPNLTQNPGY